VEHKATWLWGVIPIKRKSGSFVLKKCHQETPPNEKGKGKPRQNETKSWKEKKTRIMIR